MLELPIVPGRGIVTKMSTQMRTDFLHTQDINIDNISDTKIDLQLIQKNIESFIGTTEIPLGIVGPIIFNNGSEQELVYSAAGTLEGALIASMNRGAKAISQSGGFQAEVLWQRMIRVPMFLFESSKEAFLFKSYVETHIKEITSEAEKHSNHAKLLDIKTIQQSNNVHLRFIYTTGDASGQNMTTTCTWHAMLYIVEGFKSESNITPLDFVIEGNGASDKKVSQSNINNGRGIKVKATCNLSEDVINRILRTTSDNILRCFHPSKELAIAEGMVGYNINVANAIAAIYCATGQDLASVHESAIGFLNIEKTLDGLFVELELPNLVIGTIGGGTHLPKQSEALEIMDCRGNNKVERFAKLIAGFTLGLEMSTYAAVVSGEFAKAHEKLGRNKPVNWLLKSELNQKFIVSGLNSYLMDRKIKEIRFKKDTSIENGILTDITSKTSKKIIGFIGVEIDVENANHEIESFHVLLKSKALDRDVIKGLHIMAASIDSKLADLIKTKKDFLEYKNCHLKEPELYTYFHKIGIKNVPRLFGKTIDIKREIHIIFIEQLDLFSMKLFNTENDPGTWHVEDIFKTIETITEFHKKIKISDLHHISEFKPWRSQDLYQHLISIIIKECADDQNMLALSELMDSIQYFEEEESDLKLNKVVIHNDFNPRNIVIDSLGNPIIYDWELAVFDYPHRDIIEFLSFVLNDQMEEDDLMVYLKFHHQFYDSIPWKDWLKGYQYTLKVYIASRVSFYEVSSILIQFPFSKRILKTSLRMLEIIKNFE